MGKIIAIEEEGLRGYLLLPGKANGDGVVLTHGAGSNCDAKLLMEMSEALMAAGFTVLRFDLPFRRERPHGPPPFGGAGRDREGIRKAIGVMRGKVKGKIFAGGHSYGGRQTTMLLAEEPDLADGLLLLSYPLHPPRKPEELRTKHFAELRKRAFFVHGTRDPFGSIAEMEKALELIPAKTELFVVEGAGHDLGGDGVMGEAVEEFSKSVVSSL
jgi:uncharacterized protein